MRKLTGILAVCCIALSAQSQSIQSEKELQQRQQQLKQQQQNELQGKTTQAQACTQKGGAYVSGVCWATRNVFAPGVFADRLEKQGMLYQWNSPVGWSATDPMINSNGGTAWSSSIPAGTVWEKDNSPCPQGWRVPTKAELESLVNETKVTNAWTTQNGVAGRTFTDKQSGASVFLPAVGSRNGSDGKLKEVGTFGSYWSSEQHNGLYSYYLYFFNKETRVSNFSRTLGQSVRCVAE